MFRICVFVYSYGLGQVFLERYFFNGKSFRIKLKDLNFDFEIYCLFDFDILLYVFEIQCVLYK